MTASPCVSYRRHRFSPEVISHCVWLYFRFQLSFRVVEEMMLAQGVNVSYESIRTWCSKFGQQYARAIRRQRTSSGDTWHLDEVYLRISSRIQYLWRAVDQDGQVINVLVQPRRDAQAATRFFKNCYAKLAHRPGLT